MDFNQQITFRNYQGFSRMLINFFSFCFFVLLVTEMIFLTIKVYSYDIANCISDGIRDDPKMQNTTLLINVRQLCWTQGFFKDKYLPKDDDEENKNKFRKASDYRDYRIIKFENAEINFTRQLVIMHYCIFLILLLLRRLKKNYNLMNPIIQQLKQKSLVNYCDFDRDAIKNSIKILIEKSRTFFFVICLIRLIYFSFLFGLIWSTKFLLYGQYPIDLFDWNNLVLFPEITPIKIRPKDFVFTDSKFQIYLNIAFMSLWKIYLIQLIIFFLLILIRLIQCLIPPLRNKAILSFSPNINVDVLNGLNYSIGNYYILHKIARNIDSFYFTVLFEDTFFIKDESLGDKSEDKFQGVTVDENYCNPNYNGNAQDEEIEKEQFYNRNKPVNACIELTKSYENRFKMTNEDDQLIENENESIKTLEENSLEMDKYVGQTDLKNIQSDNQINDQIDRQIGIQNVCKTPKNVEQSDYKFNKNQNCQNQQKVLINENEKNENKISEFNPNQLDLLKQNDTKLKNQSESENINSNDQLDHIQHQSADQFDKLQN